MPFSVITSVYKNDKPQYVESAINSILKNQSICPDEIVLVIDGPINQSVSDLIEQYRKENPGVFNIIRLIQNKGLGNALRIGIDAAKYEIVARMDSDDIAVANRFESQLQLLYRNPDIDLVGGQISEFIGNENNVVGHRIVPCSHNEISKRMKSRCPFNHMTVMARKKAILKAGNYMDWHFNEDYYLWIRMLEQGCKFANLPDVLVDVRVGEAMYARRGGWKYFLSEKGLQDYMLNKKIISPAEYLFNVVVRFGVQVILPNKVRGVIFRKLFRKK